MTRDRNDDPIRPSRAVKGNPRSVGAVPRGKVTVWLVREDGRTWLGLNAAAAGGLTVDISLKEARELRDHLTVLLAEAGCE